MHIQAVTLKSSDMQLHRYKLKKKVKSIVEQATKAQRRSRGVALLFL
jgi:hypothetical protein